VKAGRGGEGKGKRREISPRFAPRSFLKVGAYGAELMAVAALSPSGAKFL